MLIEFIQESFNNQVIFLGLQDKDLIVSKYDLINLSKVYFK